MARNEVWTVYVYGTTDRHKLDSKVPSRNPRISTDSSRKTEMNFPIGNPWIYRKISSESHVFEGHKFSLGFHFM